LREQAFAHIKDRGPTTSSSIKTQTPEGVFETQKGSSAHQEAKTAQQKRAGGVGIKFA
jgi:hypothetical protein